MRDAVLPADPVEQDLDGLGTEPPGEDLAVIGEDLIRDPVALQGGGEDAAHRLGGRPGHEAARDAEAAVIIHAGDDLELAVIIEQHAAHHVHLPQLHRVFALPPAELVSALASPPEPDQAVRAEAPRDRRARWDGAGPQPPCPALS